MIVQYVIITVVNTATTTTTTYPWRVSDTQNGATVRQFSVIGLSLFLLHIILTTTQVITF